MRDKPAACVSFVDLTEVVSLSLGVKPLNTSALPNPAAVYGSDTSYYTYDSGVELPITEVVAMARGFLNGALNALNITLATAMFHPGESMAWVLKPVQHCVYVAMVEIDGEVSYEFEVQVSDSQKDYPLSMMIQKEILDYAREVERVDFGDTHAPTFRVDSTIFEKAEADPDGVAASVLETLKVGLEASLGRKHYVIVPSDINWEYVDVL